MNIRLLIPAAGMGRRLGKNHPKALTSLHGKPLLLATLRRFLPVRPTAPVLVLFSPGYAEAFEKAVASFPVPVHLVEGGKERQESVKKGLDFLGRDADMVMIHDAARPFVSKDDISAVLREAERHGAATLALPVTDTILEDDSIGFLQGTPDRSRLWACQTPQVFRAEILLAAYAWAAENKVFCTDDATLVNKAGHAVRLVKGSASNFKITTPNDLLYANFLLENDL